MKFDILTIFPNIFGSYVSESILWRAQKKKLIKIRTHNLRDAAKDRHKTIDDKPYGGGPGMVMMVEPVYKTLKKIKKAKKSQVILLDPAGRQFSQKMAEKFSQLDQLIFICGRYEGVDARVNKFIDQKISIGPYVLSGGELPALTIVEAVTRLIPGVLGNKESLLEETFSNNSFKIQSRGRGTKFNINYEYPQYTRPEIFAYQEKGKKKKLSVPRILLSGNHQVIGEWRRKHRK